MFKSKAVFAIVTLSLLAALLGACAPTGAVSQSEARRIAEEFVKKEATFAFDGIKETLKLTGTLALKGGWELTFEYDSRHGGYGDRTGQVLAQVITRHEAVVTVEAGTITRGIIDEKWDMIKQKTTG